MSDYCDAHPEAELVCGLCEEEVDAEALVADLQAIILQQEQTIRSKNRELQNQNATITDYQLRMDVLSQAGLTLKRRVVLPSKDDPYGSSTYDLEILG